MQVQAPGVRNAKMPRARGNATTKSWASWPAMKEHMPAKAHVPIGSHHSQKAADDFQLSEHDGEGECAESQKQINEPPDCFGKTLDGR
jgi:hypothetical protein